MSVHYAFFARDPDFMLFEYLKNKDLPFRKESQQRLK